MLHLLPNLHEYVFIYINNYFVRAYWLTVCHLSVIMTYIYVHLEQFSVLRQEFYMHLEYLLFIHKTCHPFTAPYIHLQQILHMYRTCYAFTSPDIQLQNLSCIYRTCYAFTEPTIYLQHMLYIYRKWAYMSAKSLITTFGKYLANSYLIQLVNIWQILWCTCLPMFVKCLQNVFIQMFAKGCDANHLTTIWQICAKHFPQYFKSHIFAMLYINNFLSE